MLDVACYFCCRFHVHNNSRYLAVSWLEQVHHLDPETVTSDILMTQIVSSLTFYARDYVHVLDAWEIVEHPHTMLWLSEFFMIESELAWLRAISCLTYKNGRGLLLKDTCNWVFFVSDPVIQCLCCAHFVTSCQNINPSLMWRIATIRRVLWELYKLFDTKL